MDRRRAVLGLCILLSAAVLWLLLWERSTPATSETAPDRRDASYVPDTGMGAGLQGSATDPAGAGPGSNDETGGNANSDAGDSDDAGVNDGEASLTIETVDGMTGRHVRGTWNLGTGKVTSGPSPAGREVTAEDIERQREAVRASRAAWVRAYLRTGETRAHALSQGEGADQRYAVRLPSGYVLDDPYLRIHGTVAAGVARTRVVLPVWREAVLDLTVSDPEGRPAEGVTIERLYAAGRQREVNLETMGPGRYRIRGIPALPREVTRAILLWMRRPDDQAAGPTALELDKLLELFELKGDLSDQSPQLITRIPPDPALPWHAHVHLGAERHESFLELIEFETELEYEERLNETGALDVVMGRVRVRALGWKGLPIVGRDLLGVTTNAEGVILIERHILGRHTFEMSLPGHLPTSATVTVEANKTTEVTLREPLGARLRVYVSDAEGRPCPSARLYLGDRSWFDVHDGVQRLDLHTNANGRRTLSRVEAGKFTLRATWGGRKGEQRVELRDGETTSVHIITK